LPLCGGKHVHRRGHPAGTNTANRPRPRFRRSGPTGGPNLADARWQGFGGKTPDSQSNPQHDHTGTGGGGGGPGRLSWPNRDLLRIAPYPIRAGLGWSAVDLDTAGTRRNGASAAGTDPEVPCTPHYEVAGNWGADGGVSTNPTPPRARTVLPGLGCESNRHEGGGPPRTPTFALGAPAANRGTKTQPVHGLQPRPTTKNGEGQVRGHRGPRPAPGRQMGPHDTASNPPRPPDGDETRGNRTHRPPADPRDRNFAVERRRVLGPGRDGQPTVSGGGGPGAWQGQGPG